MTISSDQLPFLYGAQYYRAPTPEPEFWERDLEHMMRLGCNTVKFWVQWRWSERRPGVYYWDDLDQLMILAHRFKLKVILNLICDVMPVWSEREFPDCRMVDRHGQPVATSAVICRQIGGYPGPCYNHPGMLNARQHFFEAALDHFNAFESLFAWDAWNEPEHHLGRRAADNPDHQLCYCPYCELRFRNELATRYKDIESLNRRWGRCYSRFDEIELPREPHTITDYIEWREFQLDTLTREAEWRLNLVRKHAPRTHPHLHVVPHTIHCFNSANCVDDFALADHCEIFGSTMMHDPLFAAAASSAAGDKYFYNAEWHINFGSTAIHPRIIDRATFLREAVPQLGWNVRGMLFWQFRPESLGFEAPAWGMIRADGSDRPVSVHASEFITQLEPYLPALMTCRRAEPVCAILKSRRNELFFDSFPQNKQNPLYRSIRGYTNLLLQMNIPFKFISTEQLEQDRLNNVKLLILPAAYYMSIAEAEAVDKFCRNGGCVLAEGSVAGYCHDIGRHSKSIPGCGLSEKWGIAEVESTSTYHVDCSTVECSNSGATGDTAKALSSVGACGGEYVPLTGLLGQGFGAMLLSRIEGESATVLAAYHESSSILEKRYHRGYLFYCGTYLGIAANEKSEQLLRALLARAAERAGIALPEYPLGVRLTPMYSIEKGTPEFVVAENVSEVDVTINIGFSGLDIFNGKVESSLLTISSKTATLLRVSRI